MDKINVKNTPVPDGDATRRIKVLESVIRLQRSMEDPESFGVTSETGTYQLFKTGVSWKQRVFGWFGLKSHDN